jgi:hypothetical protein
MAGVAVLGLGLTTAGCRLAEPADATARREALRLQGEELSAAADLLEERLLGNQANLLLWEEMARRHRTVSEVACRNHGEHLEEMVRLLEHQQQRARKLKRSRRMAAAEGGRSRTVAAATVRGEGKRRSVRN